MADVKTLQTRIALKYDSYANWTDESKEGQGAKLVLLAGELGICYVGDTNQESNVVPTVLFKVGDGTKTFKELPWASAKAADVYSWAKASDVVYNQDAKTITFVGGNVDGSNKVITFNYVTLAEVKAITDGLNTRIAALEGKFTGDGSVQTQINALDGRLDVIEGSGEGSVAKALEDAKAYTDEREDEIEKAYKKYADDVDAARKTYVDGKVTTLEAADAALSDRIAAFEGNDGAVAKALKDAKDYADQAEADAVEAANDYTDEREAAIKTAYETYADKAETNAKQDAANKLAAAVSTINAKDSAQDTEIGNKLDKSVYDAYINGKSMSDAELKSYADSVASTAKSEAIAAAKTETETQVSTLATGQVKTNKEAIAAMDAAYKAADTALDNKISALRTEIGNLTSVMNFRGAFDAESDVTNPVEGDVITLKGTGVEKVYSSGEWIEIGTASASDAAIGLLQGRMTTAEGAIDALEKDVEDLVTADTALDGRLDVIEGEGVGSIKKAQADAVASAKSYTDTRETAIRSELKTAYEDYANGKASAAETAAKGYADGIVATEKSAREAADSAINGDIKTLQDLTSGYSGAGSIKTAIEAAKAQADKGVEDADKAQKAADKAQGEIDALELVVNHATTGLAATKVIADDAQSRVAALEPKVEQAEKDIDALQAIVSVEGGNSNAQLRKDITALQTLTGENGAIRTEIAAVNKAVTDLTNGQVNTNKTNIAGHETRIAAIEGDYLKQADLFIINCGSSTKVTHTA